ncbi:hypothetical protein IAT38_006470 [Cryptococcus sp. DSM 104549]
MTDPSSSLPKPRSGSATTPSSPTPLTPPAYPPCHLCRGTSPLPTFPLTTLDPLIPEIRALIYGYVKGTKCRSHLVDLICTSRQLYEELAPKLYRSAVLDKNTAKGFYYGLGGPFGGHGSQSAGDSRGSLDQKEADDMAARWMSKEKAIVLRDTPHPVDPVDPSLRQPLRKLALIPHTLSLTLSDDVAHNCTLQAIQQYHLFSGALLSKMDPRAFMGRFQNDDELADAARRFLDQRSGARLFRFTNSLSLGEDMVRWMCHHVGPTFNDLRGPSELESVLNLAKSFLVGQRLDIHIPDLRSASRPLIHRQVMTYLRMLSERLMPARIDLYNVILDELYGAWFCGGELHFHLAPEDSRKRRSHLDDIVEFASWFFDSEDDE